MYDDKAFREQHDLIAESCPCMKQWFETLLHCDTKLVEFWKLHQYFVKNIYSAGDLVTKHLIPIMSVIGMLPAWMATVLVLKESSNNYQYLVEHY